MNSNSVLLEQEASPLEIRSALERILESKRFSGSSRTAEFLRFVVERSLSGRAHEIKEVVIASELYGYTLDYDPRVHSMVRVEATRVRARLRDYYEQEGAADPIRVAIPKGTYVPQFERALSIPAPPTTLSPVESESVAPPRTGSLRATLLTGVALLCGLGVWALQAKQPANVPLSKPASESREAWKDGTRLLSLDPHSASTDSGMPKPLRLAIERFERAVELDPDFAPGWASLAEAYDYAHAYTGRNRDEDRRRARDAAARAVRLDDSLAYGHAMLAMTRLYLDWDLDGAEAEYRRALQLDPKNPHALMEFVDLLRVRGRERESLDILRKARTLLPAMPNLAAKEAEVLLDLNLLDAAEQCAREAVELQKDNGRALFTLGAVFERRGKLDQALAEYRKALAINAFDRRALPAAGYVLALMNQREAALEVLHKLEHLNDSVRNCAAQIAVVHMGLGDRDAAVSWLTRARNSRQSLFPMIGLEHRFAPLYSDERVKVLLRESGVPTARLFEPAASE